ncbi:hypothetical protein [Parapedobacter indicus]|uniref:hypothetical protein n=1 Tax=Parapedobacter indicus TaxID=1477437 RepID=UPI000B899E26|nr:hypothetical protein [Parapedobacter indicus]
MKKVFAYILLVTVTANVFSLAQLLKAPVLFEHFKEHRQVDARISFLDFLTHHYSFEKHTDNDESRDMQLPFKGHLSLLAGFDFHAAIKPLHLPKVSERCSKSSFPMDYSFHIPTPFQQSQFKPPRS